MQDSIIRSPTSSLPVTGCQYLPTVFSSQTWAWARFYNNRLNAWANRKLQSATHQVRDPSTYLEYRPISSVFDDGILAASVRGQTPKIGLQRRQKRHVSVSSFSEAMRHQGLWSHYWNHILLSNCKVSPLRENGSKSSLFISFLSSSHLILRDVPQVGFPARPPVNTCSELSCSPPPPSLQSRGGAALTTQPEFQHTRSTPRALLYVVILQLHSTRMQIKITDLLGQLLLLSCPSWI